MKIIVTGGSGFLGRAITKIALEKGSNLWAINRTNATGPFQGLELKNPNHISSFRNILNNIWPDFVIHLAAKTSIADSIQNPVNCLENNLLIDEHLLQVISNLDSNPRLIIFSSSAIYDTSTNPITEDSRLMPNSPYAFSKLITERLAMRYVNSFIIRPFFILDKSKLNDPLADWYKQLLAIRDRQAVSSIKTGNLNIVRDYLELEDAAKIIISLLSLGKPGEIYNLCSATKTSLYDVLTGMILRSNLNVNILEGYIEDVNVKSRSFCIGDNAKLRKLGIVPKFELGIFLDKYMMDF